MTALHIIVGDYLFQFESRQHWITNAQRFYRRVNASVTNSIAVNSQGYVCLYGRDFTLTEERGAYPIKVYAVQDAPRPRVGEVGGTHE
jgi:hypothetical protein